MQAIPAYRLDMLHAVSELTFLCSSVPQLLVEAAETRWRSVLVGLLSSVPPTLWRLANNGSLLLQEEPSRSPGSAFVEVRGADGALAQAMLGLVFRIVRLGDERGPFDVAALVDARVVPNNEDRTEELDKRDGGGAQKNQPWTTAVEALVATATASADDQESCLGFAGRLVQLFADQDDALVNMLLLNLRIFHNTAVSAGLCQIVIPNRFGQAWLSGCAPFGIL